MIINSFLGMFLYLKLLIIDFLGDTAFLVMRFILAKLRDCSTKLGIEPVSSSFEAAFENPFKKVGIRQIPMIVPIVVA